MNYIATQGYYSDNNNNIKDIALIQHYILVQHHKKHKV